MISREKLVTNKENDTLYLRLDMKSKCISRKHSGWREKVDSADKGRIEGYEKKVEPGTQSESQGKRLETDWTFGQSEPKGSGARK